MHGVGVVLEDLGDVVRAAVDVRAMPEEVEDADPAVRPRGTGLGGVGQGPAQRICGGPGIAHGVPGRGVVWLGAASALIAPPEYHKTPNTIIIKYAATATTKGALFQPGLVMIGTLSDEPNFSQAGLLRAKLRRSGGGWAVPR